MNRLALVLKEKSAPALYWKHFLDEKIKLPSAFLADVKLIAQIGASDYVVHWGVF